MNPPAIGIAIEKGDMVFAREALFNDGFIPDLPDDALLDGPGCRGVVVVIVHAAAAPDEAMYLVGFQGDGGVPCAPTGNSEPENDADIPF